jgi:hypothetical protein
MLEWRRDAGPLLATSRLALATVIMFALQNRRDANVRTDSGIL